MTSGAPRWDTGQSLDAAFAAPPGGKDRRRLVGDLLAGPFHRYARAVRADAESFIDPGRGPVRNQQARAGKCSATTRSCCCSTSSCYGSPRTSAIRPGSRGSAEGLQAGRVGRARAARADHQLRARQRDLRDLVGRDVAGAVAASLFDIAEVLGRPVRPDHRWTTGTCRSSCTNGCSSPRTPTPRPPSTRRSRRPPASGPGVGDAA